MTSLANETANWSTPHTVEITLPNPISAGGLELASIPLVIASFPKKADGTQIGRVNTRSVRLIASPGTTATISYVDGQGKTKTRTLYGTIEERIEIASILPSNTPAADSFNGINSGAYAHGNTTTGAVLALYF